MSALEQKIAQRQTRAFIEAYAMNVVFHRPIMTTTEAGGEVQTGEDDLLPQTVRWIPFKRRLTLEFVTAGEEELTYVPYILMGMPDLDVQKKDWFTPPPNSGLGPGEYEVKFISPRRYDRVLVGIIYRGEGGS